jgi:hypothetical protein
MNDIDPCCTRPRLDINDPFFLKGYQLSWRSEGCVTIPYIEESIDVTMNMESRKMDRQEKMTKRLSVLLYPCGVSGCSKRFRTISDCESHYEESHMFQCVICASIFPSNSWLDRHLEEAHDVYFATAIERGKAFYKCWVCWENFSTVKERLFHLRAEHGYPKWFRFVPQAKPRPPKQIQKWKFMNSNLNHDREMMDSVTLESDEDDNNGLMIIDKISLSCHVMEETKRLSPRKDDEKRRKRRERQALKRSSIPCRFFSSPDGCYRGSRCAFQHTNIDMIPTLPSPIANEETIMEVLSEGMKALSVPNKISFGRKQR